MTEKIARIDRNLFEDSDFDYFEMQPIRKLTSYLENADNNPLLTIDEDDLLIDSPAVYLGTIEQKFTPKNAAQLVRENILTDKEVARRRNAGREIVRATKADIYVDRLLTATHATDQCRSVRRYLIKDEFIKTTDDDSVESQHAWVGDYVSDLLRAGRETRLLRGSAMATTTEQIRSKFDSGNKASKIILADLAGINSRKKIDLWLESLSSISKKYDRLTGTTKEKVMDYLLKRTPEYFREPDLIQLIADMKTK